LRFLALSKSIKFESLPSISNTLTLKTVLFITLKKRNNTFCKFLIFALEFLVSLKFNIFKNFNIKTSDLINKTFTPCLLRGNKTYKNSEIRHFLVGATGCFVDKKGFR